jgi:hypothetical protein
MAMVVNDNACCLNERDALESIAARIAAFVSLREAADHFRGVTKMIKAA